MSNLKIKLNLAKLKGATCTEIKSLGQVIVIPVQKNKIFVSEKGNYFLDCTAVESNKEDQTHFICIQGKKEENMPIIGNISTWAKK